MCRDVYFASHLQTLSPLPNPKYSSSPPYPPLSAFWFLKSPYGFIGHSDSLRSPAHGKKRAETGIRLMHGVHTSTTAMLWLQRLAVERVQQFGKFVIIDLKGRSV